MQLKKVSIYLLSIIFPLILVCLSLWAGFANYKPSTWLTGWDNLHSEFDSALNLKRTFSAVWEEYQGLGLLTGNAHAADLPRQLLLLPVSVFLPDNLIRYFWAFSMLVLGPLGAYFFVRQLIEKEEIYSKTSSFLAGVFYLLNLATLQYFYTPFEPFLSFYGFLPWLLYLTLKYLRQGGKKNLLILFLVSFLATPSFLVQTLFVVFMIIMMLFVIDNIFREKLEGIKKSIKILFVVIAANAFWLFPAIFFYISGAGVVTESKINSFATPETRLMNADFGGLSDIALLKGFWFNYMDLGVDGNYNYLLGEWRSYVDQPQVAFAGYLLFAASVLGISLALTRGSFKWKLALPLGFLTVYVMLASTNPPFGGIFSFLASTIPFFENVFRSVFTKWSGVAALFYASGLGLFVYCLPGFIRGIWRSLATSLLFVVGLVAVFLLGAGIYQGRLIMDFSRIDIPRPYFELFDYFKTRPKEARIAYFPAQTFWGWNFYSWGGRGSGFLWYGIEQPLLDRAFDVWSHYNEAFYNEYSASIYGLDSKALERVLDKYDVVYVLVDRSVILPGQAQENLRFDQMQDLMEKINAQKEWEKDFLSVYKIPSGEDGFVWAPQKVTFVDTNSEPTKRDNVFVNEGVYLSPLSGLPFLEYPFANLLNEKVNNIQYQDLGSDQASVSIKALLEAVEGYKLVIPPPTRGSEYRQGVDISYEGTRIDIVFEGYALVKINGVETQIPGLPNLFILTPREYPKVLVGLGEEVFEVNQGQTLRVPRVRLEVGEPVEIFVYDPTNELKVDTTTDFLKAEVKKCWEREGQVGSIEYSTSDNVRSFTTEDAVGCMDFKLGAFKGKSLLYLELPFRSGSGAKPHFCLVEEGKPVCLHDEVFYQSLTSRDWTAISRQIVLPGDNNYWLNVSARPPEEKDKSWDIDYQAPRVSVFPLLLSFTYDEDVWSPLAEERVIYVGKDADTIEVLMNVPQEKIDFANFGRFEVDNCDIFDRGRVDKRKEENSLVYEAEDMGSACDFVILNKVSTKQAYVLRFRGEGESGRGLKFYLFNSGSKHADIEALLPNGIFDESYIIAPWNALPDSGYTLNLENRSFGSEVSRNIVGDINLYRIPLEWISGWKLVPQESPTRDNPLTISGVEKKFTYKYGVGLDDKEGGFVILSQGYDKGWVALAGRKILPHHKVNSWANGWVIPEGVDKIDIIYWPQYLEFVGFGFLVLGLLSAVFLKEVDKKEANHIE